MTSPQSTNLATDERNRQRALELTSFIVEAPAGAGKTELLTQRYLKLLETVNAPEEIIAITFTNKAAAEMRSRILDSLIKAENQDKPLLPHKQITYDLSLKALQHARLQDWQLLDNPSRLRIFTIDSLCAYLARQMPLMSRFGSQPRVAEDAGILYKQAAEHTLALLEDGVHGDVLETALRYVDNDANQLTNLLVKMLEKRDQWLHHAQHEIDAEQLQNTLRYLVEQELSLAEYALPFALQQQLMPVAQFASSNLACDHAVALLADWETAISPQIESLAVWCAVADLMLTNTGEPRKEKGLNARIGFPPTDEGRAQKLALAEIIAAMGDTSALHRVRQLPSLASASANNKNAGWEIITTLSKLLNLAVAQLWLVFQRAGEVDFVEIAQRATHALADNMGEPTELALKLDYKIQHLLVDEFQDTSPSQITLLEQLTLGWQAGDGRTLFAVGDPMQSIYRFRKANVGLFIDAAKHGIGEIQLEKLQLYRNNRSCPAIVNWINQTFNPIFPANDEVIQGAIEYRSFIATKPDMPQTGIEIHPIIKQIGETSALAGQREAEAVISVIQREYAENPKQKIAVLVRSKKHLAYLVSKLRRDHKDIAFQAVEIEALQGRQIVQDLLSLTHALHHRADRVHWLALLRAPWCGLTLHDLHALAGGDHHSTIWSLMQNEAVISALSADGQMRLQHIRTIIAEAFANQGRMNVSRWVRGIWLMLGGTSCLWEQGDVIDVQAFFACLDGLDRNNAFSPERLEMEITKLFASPDSHGENLQMMTIHKSKGLEFDTVILPGLGATTGGNNSDKPLVLWEEASLDGQPELLAAPYLPKGARDKDTASPYDYLESREKVRDTNESARVLYVAATRVERKLHLLGIANLNTKGEISPTKNTYLDLLWPTVSQVFESALSLEESTDIEESIASFTPCLVRLKQLVVPPELQLTKPSIQKQSNFNAQPKQSSSLEADVGTLAHRYMEIMVKHGVDAWPLSRVVTLVPAMQHWLHQQGHTTKISIQAADLVKNLLEVTLNSKDGQWVLKTRGEAELAMSTIKNEEIKNYIVDRTFVEDNIRWIIDYKTIALEVGLPMSTLKTTADNYREQLESYATLFNEVGVQVKSAVFFMAIGKIVILD